MFRMESMTLGRMCLLLVVSIRNILNIAHKSAPEETEMDCPFPELECIVRKLSELNTSLKMSGTNTGEGWG